MARIEQPFYHLRPTKEDIYMNTNSLKAFTLIELLVVVLIIGILAAIAVPQYQKAVERSRAKEGLAALDTIVKAQQLYYLEHGTYSTTFDELDITFWEPTNGGGNRFRTAAFPTDGIQNEHWRMYLNGKNIVVTNRKGKYAGTGFAALLDKSPVEIRCVSYTTGNPAYCTDVMKATFKEKVTVGWSTYTMPKI